MPSMSKGMTVAIVGLLILVVAGVAIFTMARNDQSMQTSADASMMVAPTDALAQPDGSMEGGSADEGSDVEGVKVFTITGSSFKFDPAEIKVKKGDTVRVLFKSEGGMPHDFVIDEYEVATNELGDGEEEEIEFVADQAGSFEYYCSVGNHRAMGMVGKLVVEE